MRPMLPEARDAMDQALDLGLGHPRGTNAPARETQAALEDLGARLAFLTGARSTYFFSSGSCANAAAVLAAGRAARERGTGHIVASPVESSAVVRALRTLRIEGSSVSLMPCGPGGLMDIDAIEGLIQDDTGLLVFTVADGIRGTVQPVAALSGFADRERTWVHCDCSWAAGRIPVGTGDLGADSLGFSSVTVGGPFGCGAAVVRDGSRLPLEAVPEYMCGPNPHSSFGMTAAMETRFMGLEAAAEHVEGLKEEILQGLDSCGIRYSIIGGACSDGGSESADRGSFLPGTMLMELKGRYDRIHARMERDGVVLPSYNSAGRLSFLRRTGWDISRPDRYLGFSLDTLNSGVDAEHFVRSMATAMGR